MKKLNIKQAIKESINEIAKSLTIKEFRAELLKLHPHLDSYTAYNHLSKLYALEEGYEFNMDKKVKTKSTVNTKKFKEAELFVTNITEDDITDDDIKTFKTNTAFDIIASDFSGLMGGTQYEVSAKAGTGKTTLLSQIGVYLCENNENMSMLFISAEMSRQDWKVEVYKNPSLSNIPAVFLNDYDTDIYDLKEVISKALRMARYVIIDSSTVISELLSDVCDMKPNKAKKWIGKEIIDASLEKNSIMMCIKHVTKDGTAVGSTWDKHMFTGQLLLEAKSANSRCAFFTKNRRGGNNQFKEVYFYKNKEDGRLMFDQEIIDRQLLMESIENESKDSIDKHNEEFSQLFKENIIEENLETEVK